MKFSKLVILLAIFSLWSCNKDKNTWESAQRNNTVESYKDYISKFPDGNYKNQADSCIQTLIWNNSQKTNTVESYENYINVYPNGYYKLKADSLLEETLWNGASTNSDMEYYVKYKMKFPNGKYIESVKIHVDKYLIGVSHAGFFKVGMLIPKKDFKGYNIIIGKDSIGQEGVSQEIKRYFVLDNKEKIMELIESDNRVLRIDLFSEKFRTQYNIGVNSQIFDFFIKYPKNCFYCSVHESDAYAWYEYSINFYIEAKGENGICFQLPTEDFIGKSSVTKNIYERSDFKKDSKINIISILQGKYDDSDFEKRIVKSKAETKEIDEYIAKNEEAKNIQNKTSTNQTRTNNSNSTQNSSAFNKSHTKSYQRTYRDHFECESAIHEFLGNHTFVSSDGSKLTYSMGELTISYSRGQLQFININILGYNQNIARLRAMSTIASHTITLTIDASNGTISDGESIYAAEN